MTDPHNQSSTDDWPETDARVARRTVLKAAGASAALLGTTGVAAQSGPPEDTPGEGRPRGRLGTDHLTAGSGKTSDSPAALDPLFGKPSAGPNPCGGDAGTDCFEDISPTPDYEVELHIDLPGLLFAVVEQELLSVETLNSINEDVADGEVTPGNLHNPETELSVHLPDGNTTGVTVEGVARLLAGTVGFHFEPAGLHVEPGSVVLFSAETPDHGVAPYHARHGRQNRVPDGVGPFASPLIPVGGYWLFCFSTPGVYDCYCPPHDPFGMVFRVVVSDGEGVPDPNVENTGRPPPGANELPSVLGGLDPNVPSSLAALNSEALAPATIVEDGAVSWETVVASHRSDG
jgi:plastocyanin